MIKKIAHLGFATQSIGVSMEFFKTALGLELECIEAVEDQKVKVAMLKVGDVHLELIEATASDSPIARFLETHGEGFHHVTFEVDDLEAELQRLRELNVKLVNDKPRPGARGSRIAFIHPHSTGGILIELTEMAEEKK